MSQAAVQDAVREALLETFGQLDRLFERPAPELLFRPAYPQAWSAAEHLEHVSLANHFLLLTIGRGCEKALRRAARGMPQPEAESDLERLRPIARPGAFEWLPPPHMLPGGRATLDEVRLRLREQGTRCRELLAGLPAGEGRLCLVRMSVQGLGRLDLYQWLYFVAQHGRYHLAFLERRRGAFHED